ncbi:Scr1 family TA system antitoxin-like transcriptional regulator [Amycolatopsis sp. lyj-108]|uniref:Scr1 family TA system antitoxin-like transcriptional regulator n=1 Tax=Amycolatopsis sp. lyj-108 TaxID=2789286 RepID=UPI00397C4F4D
MANASWRQRRLARLLQQAREEKGIGLLEVAKIVGFSNAKMSRIESADSGVRDVDVDLICHALDVPEEVKDKLMELARQAKQSNWWRSYSDILGSADYIELEADSDGIFSFTIDLIPGLLQTADYCEAVIRADVPLATEEAISRRVEARMERQQQIRKNNVKVWAIIDEAALLRPIGGHDVMADQIDQLIDLTRLASVSIQVLPLAAGAHQSLGKPFTLFNLRDGFRVVGIDGREGGLFIENEQRVRRTGEDWAELAAMALPFAHSIELLRARSGEHRRNSHEREKSRKVVQEQPQP